MQRWTKRLLLTAAIGAMSCTAGQALELGDRAPKLSLVTAEGETLLLPDHKTNNPTLVWFPLAWRTPPQLCEKLINTAAANNASLVIIPIYDYPSARRMVLELAESTAESPQSEIQNTESADNSAAAAADTATADNAPANPAPLPQTAEQSQTPNAKNTVPDPQAAHQDQAASHSSETAEAEAETAEAEADNSSKTSDKDMTIEAQRLFRERVDELARQYPQAVFVCDTDNQALTSYTDSYMTNILPNPDLFIIDTHGYISWKAFYPGLTAGTLTRAILTARPKQSHQ